MRDSTTKLLKQRREAILEAWFERIVNTYPPETSRFLKREADRFRNPAGHNFREAMAEVLDTLLADGDIASLRGPLDRILRLRSIQDFTPTAALAFVFRLKEVLRSVTGLPHERLRPIEDRVDGLALLAFDVYTACREELHALRVDEVRRRSSKLMERAGAEDCGGSCGRTDRR